MLTLKVVATSQLIHMVEDMKLEWVVVGTCKARHKGLHHLVSGCRPMWEGEEKE